MSTTIYDENKAKEIENAVMCEFGCRVSEIVGHTDIVVKKVVVFLLYKFYGFEKRNIGRAYSMTWPFVPTVADDMNDRFLADPDFRNKIVRVLTGVGFRSDAKGLLISA